jgi:hypothetical protein
MTIRAKNQNRINETNAAINAGKRNKNAIFSDLRDMMMRCDEMTNPIAGHANIATHDAVVAERNSLQSYFNDLKAAA